MASGTLPYNRTGRRTSTSYIVIVQRTEHERDVYGVYKSFRKAEGDANAWGGSVEPVWRPEDHKFETERKS